MHSDTPSTRTSRPATYGELRVWQDAMKLAGDVYRLSRQLPPDERFGLAQQLRRAAVSVVSNIAEGYARRRSISEVRELRRFLLMSLGSLAEVETQLILAEQEALLTRGAAAGALDRLQSVSRMMNAMVRSLERRAEAG